MNKFYGEMQLFRVPIKEAETLNYNTGCEDCEEHFVLARKLNLDLIYNKETKDFIGVCIKVKGGKNGN